MSGTNCEELDAEDMSRLKAGHGAALNALMDRHAERLFNYLLRQLGNEADAADLAQEAFVRVYQNCARFDPERKFSTWLFTIATNLVRDRFRWRMRHREVSIDAADDEGAALQDSLPDTTGSPEEQIEARERASEVRRAVESLPEELRTPLILSEYEGMTHAEIGTVLGCSAKAIESRLSRARGRLRKRLEGLLQPG